MEEINKPAKQKDYSEFNRVQQAFYTDINAFASMSNYEIKEHAVTLLNNIAKGFPHLAESYLNLYSPAVKTIQSPAILVALQRTKFVNSFSRARVPQFIYWKQSTKKAKVATVKKKRVSKDVITFVGSENMDVRTQIMETLMVDTKTFEYLMNTEKYQIMAKQILDENYKKEEVKMMAAGKKK